VRNAKMESDQQEHKRVDNEWPTNAHLQCIVRPASRGQTAYHWNGATGRQGPEVTTEAGQLSRMVKVGMSR
jgi:hypothetical protein